MAKKKSMLIAQTSAGPLLGGLDWRLSLNGRHSTRALQEMAATDEGCTHYVLFKSNGPVLYGLYNGLTDKKPPNNAMAAAACFAQRVGLQAPNAALVLPVTSPEVEGNAGSEADEGAHRRFLVVVLADGAPLVDAVLNESSVRNTIGSEARPMWAFNDVDYPGCAVVDHEWLVEGAMPSTRLHRVPRNPWPVMVLIGLAAIAFAISWGYRSVVAAPLSSSPEASHGTH